MCLLRGAAERTKAFFCPSRTIYPIPRGRFIRSCPILCRERKFIAFCKVLNINGFAMKENFAITYPPSPLSQPLAEIGEASRKPSGKGSPTFLSFRKSSAGYLTYMSHLVACSRPNRRMRDDRRPDQPACFQPV